MINLQILIYVVSDALFFFFFFFWEGLSWLLFIIFQTFQYGNLLERKLEFSFLFEIHVKRKKITNLGYFKEFKKYAALI